MDRTGIVILSRSGCTQPAITPVATSSPSINQRVASVRPVPTPAVNPAHLHILQHSLGLDKYGQGTQYRNYYVTDHESPSGMECEKLVQLGLMCSHGREALCGGMTYYYVTPSGKEAVAKHSPAPPKLTRSQKRYRAYLKSGFSSVGTFGEYLKHHQKSS